jgi:hypothetical protein
MNVDNLISSIDFDKLKSDCLIHDFLKMYSKKKSILTSYYGSDILERYLKNAMCFPSECENCVGMNKNAILKFI